MKKIFLTLLAILISKSGNALPLGNPVEASLLCEGVLIEGSYYDFCESGVGWCDACSLRLGYYGDFVWNRHLEIKDQDDFEGKNIESASLYTNAAYTAVNFWDRLDAFAILGVTNLIIHTNAIVFSGSLENGNRLTLESDSDLSWSFGLRFTLGESRCSTRFGIEGQYFYAEPNIRSISIRDSESVYPGNFAKLKYHEWQLGVGISHRFWKFVPYLGTKLSGVKVDLGDALFVIGDDEPIQLRDLENRFEVGYAIGLTFLQSKCTSITVEGRFRDEKALYINGQFRF